MKLPLQSILIIPICALLSWGCGAKVKTTRMVPAKYQVEGVKRLSVADFDTDFADWNRVGPYISERVIDALRGGGFYAAVEAAPKLGAESRLGPMGVRWCEERNIDAMAAGTVTRAAVEGRTRYREEKKEVKTGRYKFETYYENGQQKKRRVEIVEKRTERIPVVQKEARLDVRVTLLDGRTGLKLDSDSVSERRSTEKEGDDIRYMPSDQDMIGELANDAAAKIAQNLAPHPASESIRISTDGGCKEGAKLAKKGEWGAAIESWNALLASDPENHAALYDLGVAAEVAKDYTKAEGYYLKALDLKDKGLYRKALERAGARLREKERLDLQMEGRN